jgi:ABC-2 type transport system permease protein
VSEPGVWSVAEGVAWRTLKNVVTTPSILLPSILFPLFMFTAFAGGLSQVENLPGFEFDDGYTAFQFVFVLLQSAAFGGVFTGFGVARDFEGGFARRLMLASPKRSGIVLGYAIAAFLRWVIVAALITVVALVVGMEVSGDPVDLVGMYSLALLVNVCGFMWSAGIAMRFRSIQAGPLMQMPVFILLFFAPVYVPLDLLSGAMHAVASANPITYVLEAGRSLISGQPEEVALAFGLAAALAAVLVLWAFRGLRRAEAAG